MNTNSISIRPAKQNDYVDVWSLAALDSSVVPAEPLLVAEADGALIAALSLSSGDTVADPFRRSAGAVELLRLRASQIDKHSERRPLGALRRLRRRPSPLPA